MDTRTESLIEQLCVLRKNLSDLEKQKAEYSLDVPLHIKRECEHIEADIKRIEGEMRKTNNDLSIKINEIRNLIIVTVGEYTQLSSQVSEFEKLFLTYVLLPGYQLQLTVQKRKYLEKEYDRIRHAIDRGTYINPQEIESDVCQTLKNAEVEYAYKDTEPQGDNLKSMNSTAPVEMTEDGEKIDEKEKTELIREFKRIVLPKIHSDTSDAPFEVFDVVYDAYKKRDYLLMEAFIIQYRGEIHPSSTEEPLAFLNLANEYFLRYQSVFERMERRLEKLTKDDVAQRMDNVEDVKTQMKKQNREIRKAIYDEAEQILHLRSSLEDLIKVARKSQGDD